MDIPFLHHSYTFNIFTARDLFAFQADRIIRTGAARLDLELLKQFRVLEAATETIGRSVPPDSVWLEYAYSKHHPVLQYLLTKLAKWIGEHIQDELGFPDKRDQNKWSVSKLNNILQAHEVSYRNSCSLQTFGCLEWESEL